MHLQLNVSSQTTALSKIVNMTRFTLIDVQTKATSPDGLRIFIFELGWWSNDKDIVFFTIW